MTKLAGLICAIALAFSANTASATTSKHYSKTKSVSNFCVVPGFCDDAGGSMSMLFLPGHVRAASDAQLSLEFFGDFGSSLESVSLYLDTLSLGKVLDGDSGNDIFSGPSYGSDYVSMTSLSGVVQKDALNALLVDEMLILRFSTRPADTGNSQNFVDDFGSNEIIKATLTFDVAPVPLPAGVVLLVSGLLGLGMVRTRRG